MSNTPNFRRFATRKIIVGAATIGITLGAAGLASAAQGVFSPHSNLSPSRVTELSQAADQTATDATDPAATDSTEATDATEATEPTESSQVTESSEATEATEPSEATDATDATDDTSTSNSGEDHGNSNSDSHGGKGDSSTTVAPPAAFTQTYTSAGGSITVSWTGTALTLDSVDPLEGNTAEIKDQSADRVRVEFKGSTEGRIEIRFQHGTLQVKVG